MPADLSSLCVQVGVLLTKSGLHHAVPSVVMQGGAFALHGGVSGIPPFTLADLHNDLNRWPAAYYSKQVRCPCSAPGEECLNSTRCSCAVLECAVGQ